MKAHSAIGEGYCCHFCDLDATVKARGLARRRDSRRLRVVWVYACFLHEAEAEARSPLLLSSRSL
jgi:hypothetical protein